jgi:hypothetical protein
MSKHVISSRYSKAQAHGDIPFAIIEEHGSGEILLEEIQVARQIRAQTGLERFCEKYRKTNYCETKCEYRGACRR